VTGKSEVVPGNHLERPGGAAVGPSALRFRYRLPKGPVVLRFEHGPVLCARHPGWWGSALGYIGRRRLGQPLILDPCSSVHGIGCLRVLDVAYYRWERPGLGVVLKVQRLVPFGISWAPKADGVIEAAGGELHQLGVEAGSRFLLEQGATSRY